MHKNFINLAKFQIARTACTLAELGCLIAFYGLNHEVVVHSHTCTHTHTAHALLLQGETQALSALERVEPSR